MELPGFGKQKAQIFVALLAKQLDVRPDGLGGRGRRLRRGRLPVGGRRGRRGVPAEGARLQEAEEGRGQGPGPLSRQGDGAQPDEHRDSGPTTRGRLWSERVRRHRSQSNYTAAVDKAGGLRHGGLTQAAAEAAGITVNTSRPHTQVSWGRLCVVEEVCPLRTAWSPYTGSGVRAGYTPGHWGSGSNYARQPAVSRRRSPGTFAFVLLAGPEAYDNHRQSPRGPTSCRRRPLPRRGEFGIDWACVAQLRLRLLTSPGFAAPRSS